MSATPQFTLSRQVKVKETELKEKEAKVRDHFEKLTAIVNRDERALDDERKVTGAKTTSHSRCMTQSQALEAEKRAWQERMSADKAAAAVFESPDDKKKDKDKDKKAKKDKTSAL